MSRATDYTTAKAAVLRFAGALEKADSPAELRAALMADLGSPFQSFDLLSICAKTENMGSDLARLMCEDLDAEVTS